jgi:hypothetical protein
MFEISHDPFRGFDQARHEDGHLVNEKSKVWRNSHTIEFEQIGFC